MRKVTNFLIGIVVGIGAGVLAGLLLAPKAGRDLQADSVEEYESSAKLLGFAADDRSLEIPRRKEDRTGPEIRIE